MEQKLKLVEKAYLCTTKKNGWYNYDPNSDYKELLYAKTPEQAKYKYFCGEGSCAETDLEYKDVRVRRDKYADNYEFEGRTLPYYWIQEILENRRWKEKMQKLIADNPYQKVYIYSGEHGAYWGPNSCGYTNSPNNVGVYTIEDAWAAVGHVDISKRISFEFVK